MKEKFLLISRQKSLIFVVGLFLFFKTILWVFLFPLFQQPDEQIHYATIQHHAEQSKSEKTPLSKEAFIDPDNIRSFSLTEETVESGALTQFDELKWQSENTQKFTLHSLDSTNELEIKENSWNRTVTTSPNNTTDKISWYYPISAYLEKIFSNQDTFFRFFSIRLLSVFLEALTLYICYKIFRVLSFSHLQSLIFTIALSFQPMLLSTGSETNTDIALIFSFTLFYLAALKLLNQPTFISHLLLLIALGIALGAKAPAIALVPVTVLIYFFIIQRRYHFSLKKILLYLTCFSILSISFFFLFVPKSYISLITNSQAQSKFSSPIESLFAYTDKTLGTDAYLRTQASYWGNFGWLDTKIDTLILQGIWTIEILAWFGSILFLLSRKSFDYLPKKSAVILGIGIILFLQLAIRFYDWRIFDATGKILIGTPGRYFLPTLIPHMLIITTGLGFLFTKNRAQTTLLLKILAICMILLSLYSVFNVIIPRYYL